MPTPEGETFRAAQQRLFALYEAGATPDALHLARELADRFPDRARPTAWVACLLSRLGKHDEALATLRAGLARGQWWVPERLRTDPDLAPLRDQPAFGAIVAGCTQRQHEAQTASEPSVLVFPPEAAAEQPPPLLLAFHWRPGNARDFAGYWRAGAGARGVLLAVAQSSQLEGMEEYVWDDPARTLRDAQTLVGAVRRAHRFDEDAVVLAGASQGAALAISLALQGQPVVSRGFLAVVPSLGIPRIAPGVADLLPCMAAAAQRGLRGWLVTGGVDPRRPEAERLCQALLRHDVRVRLVTEPGLGHDFPADFDAHIGAALDFLLDTA